MNRWFQRLSLLAWLMVAPLAQLALAENTATEAEASPPALKVTGISASAGGDDPRVLYILPWQSPSLPRRPRAALDSDAPELMQPLSSQELENHRQFRESLNPLVLEPIPIGPHPAQP